jgi:hypothetical protein
MSDLVLCLLCDRRLEPAELGPHFRGLHPEVVAEFERGLTLDEPDDQGRLL